MDKSKVFTSRKWRVNWYDVGQGLIMAVGAPLLYYLQTLIPGWDNPLIQAAISAGTTYLVKKLFTDSSIVLKPSDEELINKIEAEKAKQKSDEQSGAI